MEVLVLKSNIDNHRKMNSVRNLLENIPQIKYWSVDREDVDKVLRIEVSEGLRELDIIQLFQRTEVQCQELE